MKLRALLPLATLALSGAAYAAPASPVANVKSSVATTDWPQYRGPNGKWLQREILLCAISRAADAQSFRV